MQKRTYKELEPMDFFFTWVEQHERLANAVLWIEAIAFAWIVLNYEFTTNF